ncbi:ADP-ribosylglycohydrolase family protein [Nitrosomonas communis]|uniref:ADP-ribosylglycohydrolase n=1 Tax=Nitrosomonas communis TaxID=44574 RepID=A0A1I4QUE8_9PROT|nr:ADP-ribosylglycohydrolase family protein [Nitrosomonas communis]SFM43712.1 ADP-ribosylglycohydrolase [Nitrosomonas communis]
MITIRNLLCGVAVGDAIGYPLEFNSNPNADDFAESVSAKVLQASDDTQMSLFLAEAIAKHDTKFKPDLPYMRWYVTQTKPIPHTAAFEGLLAFDCMYEVRAPGKTCMSACGALSNGTKVQNDSKGNGTVMRIAPWALKAVLDTERDYAHYMQYVVNDSFCTHKNMEATESAKALFMIQYFALHKVPLRNAIELAMREVDPISRAFHLLSFVDHEEDFEKGGWVAEEAVYIAVRAVLKAKDYLDAIYNATVIEGDSDTCAAIAGALAVCYGMKPPEELIAKLDILPAIEYVSDIWESHYRAPLKIHNSS